MKKSKHKSSLRALPWQPLKYLNRSQWLAKLHRLYSNIDGYVINLF